MENVVEPGRPHKLHALRMLVNLLAPEFGI